tara:strand:+ start:230 stop:991 length:762 start_codon:yes stop_codon:yes gene_type:complete
MKKTYFLHESTSFQDYKIIKMRSKLGIQSYGIFWALLELLFNEENKLCIDDYEPLAFSLQCDANILKQVIEDFDLFVLEDGCFYSKRLNNHIEDINTKSNKAKESAAKRWSNANAKQTQSDSNASISISNSISSSKSKSKIKDRIHEFKNSVYSHKDFDKEDLENFFLYWSELNKSGSKMRFELERTWSLTLRLKRWVNNGFNKDKNKIPDYFDEFLYKKMNMESKKEYEKKLKANGWEYIYNPNSGGKWIKK